MLTGAQHLLAIFMVFFLKCLIGLFETTFLSPAMSLFNTSYLFMTSMNIEICQ